MNQKQQLEKDIQALEAKLNEMKATVEAMPPEAPARWVPKVRGEWYSFEGSSIQPYRWDGSDFDRSCWSVGNVHRTKEEAETYRLRLESFVPALGPETPGDDVLTSGYVVDFDGSILDPLHDFTDELCPSYQDGTWHPTREAAEEWLAKYGKVRGYK